MERTAGDGFFAGVLGIFGHGNVDIGQALQRTDFPYVMMRNEQSSAPGGAFAKTSNRLKTYVYVVGGQGDEHDHRRVMATINRLPVLLLPGDIFARGM
jgi:3D-(3,5/4)-trihydroxycyclohexane-1,2-dione acylhydrolase (decyclizing)